MKEVKVLKDIRFVNVGENPPKPKPGSGWNGRRQWDACMKYNFISAGQAEKYNKPLSNLKVDDVIAAFITGCGYVGIGIVKEESVMIKDFSFNGKTLKDLNIDDGFINGTLDKSTETVDGLKYLRKTIFRNAYDEKKSEYAVRIDWEKTVLKKDAWWKKNYGLFANSSIQSNIKAQSKTIDFLEECFNIKLIK